VGILDAPKGHLVIRGDDGPGFFAVKLLFAAAIVSLYSLATCPFRLRSETTHLLNMMLVRSCWVLRALAGHMDGGVEMVASRHQRVYSGDLHSTLYRSVYEGCARRKRA
jgi:hypothetical protein